MWAALNSNWLALMAVFSWYIYAVVVSSSLNLLVSLNPMPGSPKLDICQFSAVGCQYLYLTNSFKFRSKVPLYLGNLLFLGATMPWGPVFIIIIHSQRSNFNTLPNNKMFVSEKFKYFHYILVWSESACPSGFTHQSWTFLGEKICPHDSDSSK